MTMHMEGPWLSTTGKKKGKKKFRNADVANRARQNAESWQAFLDKWGVKDEVLSTKVRRATGFDPVVRNAPVVENIGGNMCMVTVWSPLC